MSETISPPPGTTSKVRADRVLVLAPHYDDEVLGCGGLLLQLAKGGAQLTVCFLTDSSGGGELRGSGAEGQAYAERRRKEAEAAIELLGVGSVEYLGLVDGGLEDQVEPLAAAVRRQILKVRPDLLLVPSPLERTADHRAAFAAVDQVLGSLRPGTEGDRELWALVEGLRIFAYDVNHAGFCDLLVDVSAEVEILGQAMAAYSSQEERHNYWAASLGLRRFRSLSLGPEVEAAEGYRALRGEDFARRSTADLLSFLGAVPDRVRIKSGPLVSVVVRTKDRPELLREALESLAGSTYRQLEVLVVNDGGEPPELPDLRDLTLRCLDLPRSVGRAGAAQAGVEAVTGQWVAFLDDDDRVLPEHFAQLVAAAVAPGVRVVYSDAAVVVLDLASGGGGGGEDQAPGRGWREVERRLPYSRDFDADLLLLDNYIPFNTLLIERQLLEEVGPFDEELPFFEDWDLLVRLAERTRFHHLRRVSCEYRHFRHGGHHIFGEAPRQREDFLAVKARLLNKHSALSSPLALARAIDQLRNEAVEVGEESERRQASVERERELRQEAEVVLRQTQTAAADLEAALEDTRAELARLWDDEKQLRQTVDDQTEHLGRAYAEIERLNGLLDELRKASNLGLLRWRRDERRRLGESP